MVSFGIFSSIYDFYSRLLEFHYYMSFLSSSRNILFVCGGMNVTPYRLLHELHMY